MQQLRRNQTWRLALVCALCALAWPAAAAAWSWPVDGPVLRPFALGADPYAGGQHRGVDVGASVGDAVRAPVSGTVSFAGSVPNGGRALTIRTGDGYSITLLQLGALDVTRGETVAEGVRIGSVGDSADAVTRAPHVHLGVRRTDDEDGYLDPLAFLPERTKAPVSPPQPAAPVPQPLSPPAPEPAVVPAVVHAAEVPPAAPAAQVAQAADVVTAPAPVTAAVPVVRAATPAAVLAEPAQPGASEPGGLVSPARRTGSAARRHGGTRDRCRPRAKRACRDPASNRVVVGCGRPTRARTGGSAAQALQGREPFCRHPAAAEPAALRDQVPRGRAGTREPLVREAANA